MISLYVSLSEYYSTCGPYGDCEEIQSILFLAFLGMLSGVLLIVTALVSWFLKLPDVKVPRLDSAEEIGGEPENLTEPRVLLR